MFWLILFPLLFSTVYAVQVTEIQYEGSEYLELLSNQTLNLSDKRIYDDQGPSKFNTLSLLQESNSSLYLIAGSNFYNEHNLSSLNCTLYITDRSQLSNGGLKDSGEDLLLEINETFNLTFLQESHLSQNRTPCFHINPNNSEIDSIESPLLCEDTFTIDYDTTITSEKIQFSFDTTADNYSINYTILDFNNNTVRETRTTLNTNKKSFTPKDKTEVYRIVSHLTTENCSYSDSKLVTYVSSKEDPKELNSFIKILNKEDLNYLKTTTVEFEAQRGSQETKTVVYLYHNGKEISKVNLQKNEKKRIKEKLSLEEGINDIVLEGLGLQDEVYINNKDEFPVVVENTFTIGFEKPLLLEPIIEGPLVISSLLYLSNTSQGDCHIAQGRKELTPRQNITNTFHIFNLSLISFKNTTELDFKCRYKEKGRKSFKYLSISFNFTSPQEISKQTSVENTFLNRKEERTTSISTQPTNFSTSYTSKNVKIKERSSWFLLIGSFGMIFFLLSRKTL